MPALPVLALGAYRETFQNNPGIFKDSGIVLGAVLQLPIRFKRHMLCRETIKIMTNLSSSPSTPAAEHDPILIKGSWESLLAEAQEMAGTQNDEAIPRFEKIVQRLSKMPKAQRMASCERLQQVLIAGAISFQAYLTLRSRYTEALDVLHTLAAVGSAEDQAYAQFQTGLVLFIADRDDEAFALLHQQATAPTADISDWGHLVINYLRRERIAEAKQAVKTAIEWIDSRYANGMIDEDELEQLRGYIASLRAEVAIKKGAWANATAHYDAAMAVDPLYQENVHIFYTSLMQAGQPALALPYIKLDVAHPIRSNFWQGVAHYRLQEPEKANKCWEQVLAVDLEQTEETSFSEYVLTHYYLGDEERIGLGNVLRVLQENQRHEWQVLFLAALGWAIQGKHDNAEADLQFAINQRKTSAAGLKLPYQVWTYLRDLLDEAAQTRFLKYFDMRWP